MANTKELKPFAPGDLIWHPVVGDVVVTGVNAEGNICWRRPGKLGVGRVLRPQDCELISSKEAKKVKNTPDTGIAKAVAQFKSQEALADEMGVKKQAVQQWVAKGYVPLDRIADVSALSGVPREELVDPRYKAVLS